MTAFQRAGAGWPTLQPKHWLCGTVAFILLHKKKTLNCFTVGFSDKVYIIISCRFSDVLAQCRELDTWTQDFVFPAVVWISGLFSPQSFLTGKTNAHMNIQKKTCCHCTESVLLCSDSAEYSSKKQVAFRSDEPVCGRHQENQG